MENNKSIFSDDPQAIEKLDAKIEKLEKRQAFMKAANKCVKKKDKKGFLELEGASERLWSELNQPDSFGSMGFAPYALTNNNANIRRLKVRRSALQKVGTQQTEAEDIKGVRMVRNVEANRIQLFFSSVPAENVRNDLFRKYAFRWCRSEGASQRHLNNAGISAAKRFLEGYQPDSE